MSNYISVCEEAARTAGEVILSMLGKVGFREKKPADLVTEADTATQDVIRRIVLTAFPQHGFLGEETVATDVITPLSESKSEGKSESASRFRWIVDPIDGTTNFVHNVPFFCTSIALVEGETIRCGVVFNPVSGEFFSAENGQGAFLNGESIHTSSIRQLSQSLVSIGFPPRMTETSPDMVAFLRLASLPQAVRRTGSSALNLAYVAAGRFDSFWNYGTSAWDVAAGVLLVLEAGGIVTAPNGQPFSLAMTQTSTQTSVLAAATAELHESIREKIADIPLSTFS